MKIVALLSLLTLCLVVPAKAQDTGLLSPTGFADDNGVSNEGNGYSSNNQYVAFNNTSDQVDYTTFNMSIPSTATITGIIVYVEGNISSGSTVTMRVQLGWDDGNNYTSLVSLPTFTTSDNVYTAGGSTDTWAVFLCAPSFSPISDL